MKKSLIIATSLFSLFFVSRAQEIPTCGSESAKEYFLKNLPGYAAQINKAEATWKEEYQNYLKKNNSASRTSSVDPNYTFTVPVVFHVLHLGEPVGVGNNISDQVLIDALAQVNRDFAREGADIDKIDPLFEPLYINSNMKFVLAQKAPNGKCTNGIVRHKDANTSWSQEDLLNFQYSTMASGNWNPTKYLNIYIVDKITYNPPNPNLTIVGYTFRPGSAPVSAADAVVYNNDYLSVSDYRARSLSHELGHFFSLNHTFGNTNNPGYDCGDDGINDTPKTTGFLSKCPKVGNYKNNPSVTNPLPLDSSDVVMVTLRSISNPNVAMVSNTPLGSLTGTISTRLLAGLTPSVITRRDTLIYTAKGVAGSYSDFSNVYGNDIATGLPSYSISIKSTAKSTDNNYVRVYIDYNGDGDFDDTNEAVFNPMYAIVNYSLDPFSNYLGTRTFSSNPTKINKTYTLSIGTGTDAIVSTYTTTPDSFVAQRATITFPTNLFGIYRMRVITSNSPITNATVTPSTGEIEDYNLNIGDTKLGDQTVSANQSATSMITCDKTRPNINNFMDYSSCGGKMFTAGQTTAMRLSAMSTAASRNKLTSDENLYFTGILSTKTTSYVFNPKTNKNDTINVYSNPSTLVACAPEADFYSNKTMTCADGVVNFISNSYNGTVSIYSWIFEGGNPSTSNAQTQSVTYSTPGTYSVSLEVSNANGSSIKTVKSFITTSGASKPITVPFSENFESQTLATLQAKGWGIKNYNFYTPTWKISKYGAESSSKSIYLPNADTAGYSNRPEPVVDVLELPSMDFSNTSNIKIAFTYSFARKTNVVKDTFKLQYSLDCGGSWKTFLGSPLTGNMATSTGNIVNAPYIPTSAIVPNPKWKIAEIAPILNPEINNQKDVKIRFWFRNDVVTPYTGQPYYATNSQNLYIDNINISGLVGIHEFENSINLILYPNPTNSSTTLEFTSPNNSPVTVLVHDVTGRVVEQQNLIGMSGVKSNFKLNANGLLKSGIYFITLNIDNNKVTKKLIIQ